jgi:hypothetical protein
MDAHSRIPQVPTRRFAVAIDFGTYAAGIAFKQLHASSSTGNPARQFFDWPDQPAPYPKTRSAILYDGRQPIAWGWPARTKYLELLATGCSLEQYTYLQNFKLALDQDSGYDMPAAFDPVSLRTICGF